MNVKQLDEKLFQAAMHRVRKGHDARAYAEAANDFGRSVSFFVVVGLIVWYFASWRWALIPIAMAIMAFMYRGYMLLITNRMRIVQEVGLEALELRR
jgi:fatty acid desaturase